MATYTCPSLVISSVLNTIFIPNNTVRMSKEIPSDKVHKNGHCMLLSKWIVSFSGCLQTIPLSHMAIHKWRQQFLLTICPPLCVEIRFYVDIS